MNLDELSGRTEIDGEICPVNPGGLLREEESYGVGNFGGGGKALERAAPTDRLEFVAGEADGHFGFHIARGDGVDANADFAELAGERFGEADEAGFSSTIGREAAEASGSNY